MNRAIFLDRDGVINKKLPEGNYVTDWELFEFLPGVKDALNKLAQSDYKIIVVTNQRCIAKGLLNVNDLGKIHREMLNEIVESGGRIDAIYFCPHEDEKCDCRKPLAGMLDKAKNELNIDLKSSWVIGDSIKDIEMAKSRNCKSIYLGKGNLNPDFVVDNLLRAVSIILK